MRALFLSIVGTLTLWHAILFAPAAFAQPGVAPVQRDARASYDACMRERRAQLDAIDRTGDPAERSRMAASVRRCAAPASTTEPSRWRYDVRVGRHATSVWEAESDTPYGSGTYFDVEAGPRPRPVGLSITGFASFSRFSWAERMEAYDETPNPTYSYTFVDTGARANAHLGCLRLGLGLGAQLAVYTSGASDILPLAQLVVGLDVPIWDRYKVTTLAMISWGGVHGFPDDGWFSARVAAGISF